VAAGEGLAVAAGEPAGDDLLAAGWLAAGVGWATDGVIVDAPPESRTGQLWSCSGAVAENNDGALPGAIWVTAIATPPPSTRSVAPAANATRLTRDHRRPVAS